MRFAKLLMFFGSATRLRARDCGESFMGEALELGELGETATMLIMPGEGNEQECDVVVPKQLRVLGINTCPLYDNLGGESAASGQGWSRADGATRALACTRTKMVYHVMLRRPSTWRKQGAT